MTLQLVVTSVASGQPMITVQVPDQATANAWIANASMGLWGKPDRWLTESVDSDGVIHVPGEDITKSDQTRVVTITPAVTAVPAVLDSNGNVTTPAIQAVSAVTQTQAHFPAEFTITQTDVSAQVAVQQGIQNGLKAQQIGAQVIAQVWQLNEAKNLSAQDFATLLADANLAAIERLLWNGSLKTAKAMITAYTGTAFSSSDKTAVIATLDASGLD